MVLFQNICLLVLLAFIITPASRADDYKVGDKLPKDTSPSQSTSYRKLIWDDLIPSDWDPMKPLKGLKLDKLDDSDPRAIEALAQAKAIWNSAPVVSELSNKKIEIPGFVVPLDIESRNVREFLLVPYFGACIHVPPPPGNQTIHVVMPKNLSKSERKFLSIALSQYGPLVVSGVIENTSTSTSMGFSGYKLKLEKISEYKSSPTFQ